MNSFLIITVFLSVAQVIFVDGVGLIEEFTWTRINYAWNSEQQDSSNGNNGQIRTASRFGEYRPSSYQSSGQRISYSTSVSSSVSMSQAGRRPVSVPPTQSTYASGSESILFDGSTNAQSVNRPNKNTQAFGNRPNTHQQVVVVEEVPFNNWDANGNTNTNSGYGSGNINTNIEYGNLGVNNANTAPNSGSSYGSTNQNGGQVSANYGNAGTSNGGSYGNLNTNSGFESTNNENTGTNSGGTFENTNGNSGQESINNGNLGNDGRTFVPNEENTNYDYVTNIPMGANVWQNKLFITVPRRRQGVPSTLNYVPLNSKDRHNVPLIPYPSWRQNAYPDQTGRGENFVSVYRVAIDICDRLWFVDTGILETLGNRTVAKPHELVVMDLQTDNILHRYSLPDDVVTSATVLASLTVDSSKDDCGNAFVYFPDLAGYGLIVYSLRENKAWRVTHNYFYLEPQAGEFRISGHDFQWNDGVFSVELSDKKPDGFRDMFFHSMAGTHMYKVSTRVLRNETLATRSYHGDDFETVGDRGQGSQTSSADIHKKSNVMFLGLVNQNALGCWNVKDDLKTISIVQKDDENMIYPSDVKVSGDKVYVLTNTMPEFLYGRLDYDRTNFRVWSNDVSSAISGTKCQKNVSNGY